MNIKVSNFQTFLKYLHRLPKHYRTVIIPPIIPKVYKNLVIKPHNFWMSFYLNTITGSEKEAV